MLVRPAEPNDALNVARVHVRAWQVGYRDLLPAAYLDTLRPEERAARYNFASHDIDRPTTLVAIEDGGIRGFATTMRSRDVETPDHGELCALYVDPDWWGRDVGRSLIAAARTRLVEQGYRQAILWLLAGNTRAEHFYQRDGWTPDGRSRTESVWGIAVNESRYHRMLTQEHIPPR